MLNITYCRVSTEEQAAEGFSIDGQAEKLRAYAELHDLGPVMLIEDPGRSGKNLERPGLQQLLAMVEQGRITNVLVWRLDRLSRNLGDLILLADTFGKHGVGLHSFTEKIDLSSATGRMFYNILGAFAQFYREQLAENVRLGMQQAAREGRWTNRPKMGYDLVDGHLIPNAEAPIVRRIFALRADGLSLREIEERTRVKYSTVRAILHSRIYLGEVLLSGEWFPGHHESLVSPQQFAAAHRGHLPGRPRSRHLLSGRIRCGLCGRVASVRYGRDGAVLYRCRHRGRGCAQPSRSASGLERAALLGLRLLADDEDLQEAIRRQLGRVAGGATAASTLRRAEGALPDLADRRRKLLDLYYSGKIDAELFSDEEERLANEIRAFREEDERAREEAARHAEVSRRFDEVLGILRELKVDEIWAEATDQERRVLVEELLDVLAIFPDHLEVTVKGAPRLNVTLDEVGLKGGWWLFVGVGGGI
ncbi:MAG TPA: recombinase family protein [Actinomycetota bacterium]|nr:recombinase family protein [Actinomycetota bacterium]